MRLQEYVAHQIIGSSLENTAFKLRDVTRILKRRKHPELHEIYLESSRSKLAMNRIIKNSMNCIDVGAHLGSVLNLINESSPNGKHIAIEPITYKCKWLKRKFPNVEIIEAAVSDTDGEVDFYLQSYYSSLSGLKLHRYGNFSEDFQIIKVNTVRLDDIVPSEKSIGFIKIDVEGGELAALRGAKSILKRDRPIILFECAKSSLKVHNVSQSEVYEFFQGYGYSLFLIKDWLEHNQPLDYERFLKSMEYPFQAFNFLAIPKEKTH